MTTRTLLAGVLVVMLLGGGVAGASGWFDEAHFSAGVSSGTWTSTPTPEPSPSSTDGDQGSGTPQPSPRPSTPGGGQTPADRVITAGNDHTVVSSVTWADDRAGTAPVPGTSQTNRSRGFCATVVISGADTAPGPWALTVDLSVPPFEGNAPNTDDWGNGGTVTVSRQGNTLFLTGVQQDWAHPDISSAQTRTLVLCTSNLGWQVETVPEDTYWKASQTPAYWDEANGRACTVLTVQGTVTDLGANPFYFGWSRVVDLSATKELFALKNGGTQGEGLSSSPQTAGGDNFKVQRGPGDGPVADQYTLTSSFNSAIRGMGEYSVTICVTRYNSDFPK